MAMLFMVRILGTYVRGMSMDQIVGRSAEERSRDRENLTPLPWFSTNNYSKCIGRMIIRPNVSADRNRSLPRQNAGGSGR